MNSIQNGYMMRYFEQNMLFSRTVVVKLKEAADLINEGLVSKYGSDSVNIHDPTTWKYYLNLSGQYHSTDRIMSVVSIDTLETIDFTFENLKIHTATAKAHRFGTRQYYSLVSQYPEQEMLINGILNPVDIDVAIASESGTILTYPEGLIEKNEVSLIAELEHYIKNQFHRWYNVQFAMSDNLFCAAFFTVLHTFILPKLLNLRLARCKTDEAHSFHVQMYLASHGELDRYLPYLSLKQALWLYRNISYLERNPGKMSQFVKLIQRVLTERGIPLGEYSVRHLDAFDENYWPEQIARIRLLNTDTNSLSRDYHSVQALYSKEINEAPDNTWYMDAQVDQDLMRFKTANSAITQTKVLHSSMVDYSNAVPEPFEIVALRQWCYMANNGLYDVVITFKDPKTSEPYSLFAKDAFVYLQYILMNAEGLRFEVFFEYLNMQQRIHPKPSIEDLLSVVDYQERDLRSIAELVLSGQPNIVPCYSVSSFYELVQKLTDEAYWHWYLISSTQDYYERALVENMIRRLYEDVRVQFEMSSPYVGTWLNLNNLPEYNLDYTEAQLLAKEIFEAATGLKIDNARMLKNIQKAMIDLVTELSSYSVQYTREINDSDITPINWPAIRFGNQRQSQINTRNLPNGSLVLDGRSHQEDRTYVPVNTEFGVEAKNCQTCYHKAIEIDPSSTVVTKAGFSTHIENYSPASFAAITYPGQDEALEEMTGLPGYTSFDRLPESARLNLKSKYH